MTPGCTYCGSPARLPPWQTSPAYQESIQPEEHPDGLPEGFWHWLCEDCDEALMALARTLGEIE